MSQCPLSESKRMNKHPVVMFLRDLKSVLYDEDGCMSCVRLAFAVSFIMLIITWIAVLFFGKDNNILMTIASAPLISSASYIGKKFTSKGERHYDELDKRE